MRLMHLAAALLATLTLTMGVAAQPAPAVDALVKKLGSAAYAQRELARKELEAIGPAALDALKRAEQRGDMETRRRVAELIAKFERQLLTRELLTPKLVTLQLKAVSPDEAIKALVSASGYTINIEANQAKLAGKKITLSAAKKPFWEALDEFCVQAGLIEKIDLNATPLGSNSVRIAAKKGMRLAVVEQASSAAMAPITLVERGSARSAVSYAGAVKTELRIERDADERELKLQFIVSAEPSLLLASVEGKPLIDRAADAKGARLAEALPEPKYAAKANRDGDAALAPNAFVIAVPQRALRRATEIKLKESAEATRTLKELAGKLTLQFDRHDQLLAKIPKVMQAAGKSAAGANGGTLRLDSIRKLDGGDIEAQISMQNLTQNPLGQNIILNGNAVIVRGFARGWAGNFNAAGNPDEMPALLDAKGQKIPLVNTTRETTSFINGNYNRSVTVIYRPGDGVEAADLVLFGTRGYMIDVPFRFENLPVK